MLLTDFEKTSLVYNQAKDSLDKASSIFPVLVDLFAEIDDTDVGHKTIDHDLCTMFSNVPNSFIIQPGSGRQPLQFSLEYTLGSSRDYARVYVRLAGDDYTNNLLLVSFDATTGELDWNLSPLSNYGITLEEIVTNLSSSMSINQIIADAADLFARGEFSINDFTAIIKSKLSGLEGDAYSIFNNIIDSSKAGVSGFLNSVSGLFKSVGESEINKDDYTWNFSENDMYVSSFSWGVLLDVASNVAAAVGTIIMAFSRVAGLIALGLSAAAKVISFFVNVPVNQLASYEVDRKTDMYNYAVPYLQLKLNRDNAAEASLIEELKNLMGSSNANKIYIPGMEGHAFIDPDGNYCVELFLSCRTSHLAAFATTYFTQEFTVDGRAMYARNSVGNINSIIEGWYQLSDEIKSWHNDDADQNSDVNIVLLASLSAFFAAVIPHGTMVDTLNVTDGSIQNGHNIWDVIDVCYNVAYDHNNAVLNADFHTSMLCNDVAKLFAKLWDNKSSWLHDSLCSVIKSCINNTTYLRSLMAPAQVRGVDFLVPPKYTKGAVWGAVIIGAVAVVVTTAVAVATYMGVRKKTRAIASNISKNTEAAWEEYKKSGSKDDLKAYQKAAKKQNTIGRIVGCSPVSYSGYWNSPAPAANAEDAEEIKSKVTSIVGVPADESAEPANLETINNNTLQNNNQISSLDELVMTIKDLISKQSL